MTNIEKIYYEENNGIIKAEGLNKENENIEIVTDASYRIKKIAILKNISAKLVYASEIEFNMINYIKNMKRDILK